MKRFIGICILLCGVIIGSVSCDEEQDDVAKTPEIKVTTSNGQIMADAAGGRYFIDFTIENPVEGGVVSVEIPQANDWITDPELNAGNAMGTVAVTILENTETESRNDMLTLRYTYGDNSVTAVASILQKETEYDHVVDCTSGILFYYGTGKLDDPDMYSYYLRIADSDLNAEERVNTYVYSFDLYFTGETEDRLPQPGVYNMVAEGSEKNYCFTDANTLCEYYGEDINGYSDYIQYNFTEGVVSIEKEGDVYTISVNLTDEEGKIHLVRYSGKLQLEDMTSFSTLEDDIDVDITGYTVTAIHYGDYYDVGYNNWVLQIMPEEMQTGKHFLFLELLSPLDVNGQTGLSVPVTFESTNTGDPNSEAFFMPGQYEYQLSWFMTCGEYDELSGDMEVVAPSAPFFSGTISIEPNEDGTIDFSTDAYDDLGYNIKVTGNNLYVKYHDFATYSSKTFFTFDGK